MVPWEQVHWHSLQTLQYVWTCLQCSWKSIAPCFIRACSYVDAVDASYVLSGTMRSCFWLTQCLVASGEWQKWAKMSQMTTGQPQCRISHSSEQPCLCYKLCPVDSHGYNRNWILPVSIFPSEMFSYHEEGAGKISCVLLSSFLSGMALQCSQERAAQGTGSRKVSTGAGWEHCQHSALKTLLLTAATDSWFSSEVTLLSFTKMSSYSGSHSRKDRDTHVLQKFSVHLTPQF